MFGFALALMMGTPVLQPATDQPSFRCAAAAGDAERIVCDDAELRRLDRIVGDLYAETRSLTLNSEQANEAWTTQRGWLAARNRCADLPCVRRSYLQRIADLAGQMPPA